MISNNVKDYYDESYQLMRVLKSNPNYASFLKEKIEVASKIDGAVFMPEHLININEVFIVGTLKDSKSFNVNIKSGRPRLYTIDTNIRINDINELERLELNMNGFFVLTGNGFGPSISKEIAFISKNKAIKYATREMEKFNV